MAATAFDPFYHSTTFYCRFATLRDCTSQPQSSEEREAKREAKAKAAADGSGGGADEVDEWSAAEPDANHITLNEVSAVLAASLPPPYTLPHAPPPLTLHHHSPPSDNRIARI